MKVKYTDNDKKSERVSVCVERWPPHFTNGTSDYVLIRLFFITSKGEGSIYSVRIILKYFVPMRVANLDLYPYLN